MDVLGRAAQSAAVAQQSGVHPQGADRPHLLETGAFGAEQSVEPAIDVGDDDERNRQVLPVRRQSFGRGERDDHDASILELIDVIANGGHVLLARQSSQVPVQHEHERSTELIRGSPHIAMVIHEFDPWQPIADPQRHQTTLRDAERRSHTGLAYLELIR